VEELARVRIASNRLGVVCRSDAGVYEVEEHLKKVHGDRLGLLILQKDDTTYTLRQVDPFLHMNLEDVYERLNLLDSSVDGDRRWGGSSDIGGSPRGAGTALSLDEIVDICRWVYQPPGKGRRWAMAGAGVVAVAAVIGATVLAAGLGLGLPPGLLVWAGPAGYRAASLVLLGLGVALTLLGRSRFPGYFGLRRPRGLSFFALLPVTAGLAMFGGGWIPLTGLAGQYAADALTWRTGAVLLSGVVGIELVIRGALYGLLVTVFPVSHEGRWRISAPNAVAAVTYAVAVAVCFEPTGWTSWVGSAIGARGVWMGAALVMGMVLGAVRECWRSVWAAVVLHAVTAAIVWGVVVRFLNG
jgi:hypothetical protein